MLEACLMVNRDDGDRASSATSWLRRWMSQQDESAEANT